MTKIQFLETSAHGMRWMKRYFKIQSQLNNAAAFTSFSKARALLKQEPLAGHRFDDLEHVRELKIRNSAFSILYTYKNDTVYIIDVRDQRGTRSAEALREFTNELKKKYGL